ncbi:unnamed protein product [Ilex paraguariensis]|uniref:Uncharacterized protein n=1 Tax=Ilex paraguariensis TaxID=185542 RepID=A0ABC8TUR0_9AQUA
MERSLGVRNELSNVLVALIPYIHLPGTFYPLAIRTNGKFKAMMQTHAFCMAIFAKDDHTMITLSYIATILKFDDELANFTGKISDWGALRYLHLCEQANDNYQCGTHIFWNSFTPLLVHRHRIATYPQIQLLAKAKFIVPLMKGLLWSLNKLACPDCHEATCGVATAEDGGWAAGCLDKVQLYVLVKRSIEQNTLLDDNIVHELLRMTLNGTLPQAGLTISFVLCS